MRGKTAFLFKKPDELVEAHARPICQRLHHQLFPEMLANIGDRFFGDAALSAAEALGRKKEEFGKNVCQVFGKQRFPDRAVF